MMGNKVGFLPPARCHGILVELIERPGRWTWDDAELTAEAKAEIARLKADGRDKPRPLARPAATATPGAEGERAPRSSAAIIDYSDHPADS